MIHTQVVTGDGDGQITCSGNNLLKGNDKMHTFPQLVKSMHIFPPIDLKFTKLQQKRLKIGISNLIYIHPALVGISKGALKVSKFKA